jgi:hypothetical protein
VTGFRAFDDVMANGDTCYYSIEAINANGVRTGEWETGLGTFNDTDTLVRTTVHKSSNANAAVNFSAGTKRVMLSATARHVSREGTAFPSSPRDRERFYRTDRDIEYFYDLPNTQWLSTQVHTIFIGRVDGLAPQTATSNSQGAPNPWSGLYDIYVLETAVSVISIGAGNWTVAVTSLGTGGATLSSFVVSAAGDALTRTAVNAAVPSTIHRFGLPLTENSGTMSLYVQPVILCRLIG